ncbi:hypothetical protein MAPG_08915 [Magnaporthiopsis poae ATCC 64411]|uniref:Uncharacterized protein n=1 Tax=Magnaporthiopsis poae (strain ATCC 64411 / 73-15) TaxID=644358 RepID=A0A0C4E8K6_MAGP6|nr:hypothetical protein MAPG_08915 [Magnaporthiopsis poae ATCC 64411]
MGGRLRQGAGPPPKGPLCVVKSVNDTGRIVRRWVVVAALRSKFGRQQWRPSGKRRGGAHHLNRTPGAPAPVGISGPQSGPVFDSSPFDGPIIRPPAHAMRATTTTPIERGCVRTAPVRRNLGSHRRYRA